jgi:hypothetical protein
LPVLVVGAPRRVLTRPCEPAALTAAAAATATATTTTTEGGRGDEMWLDATFDRVLQVSFMGLVLFFLFRLRQDAEARDARLREDAEAREARLRQDAAAREARLRQELRGLTEEVRYEMTPAQRARIEGSILAVVRGGGNAVGVAFFVSSTTALTAAHNLALGKAARHVKAVTCFRAEGGERFLFVVAALDAALGVAVLRLSHGHRGSAHFLTVPRSIDEASNESGLFFVTCNICMAAEAPDAMTLGVATHKARVIRLHPHSILYDAPAFDGDSGGAVVVARTGVVIGLHRELVNAAREIIEHKTDLGERLDAFEASLRSLISGTSFGCVGVRLDCDTVRGLLGVTE